MKIISSSLLVALLLPTTTAFAEVQSTPASRYDACARVTGIAQERCLTRRERRVLTPRFENAKNAAAAYEQVDLKFRQAAAEERKQRRLQDAAAAAERKTYRELTPTDDVNTQRLDYLNDFKQQQLACMLMAPGRTRSICLDSARNEVRRQMKLSRGVVPLN